MAKKRIGVFVCHCGRNIADTVDVEKVAQEASKLPDVAYATTYKYMCSDPGQKLIQDAIKEHDLDGVVIAACTPTMHEETFRRAVSKVGLNRYLCEIANIREHCSWVHHEKEKATKKATNIVASLVEKVSENIPLEPVEVDVTRRALVIGGGIAGIQAALDLADAGIEVVLVEKSPTIGGNMAKLSETFPTLDCAQCILTPKMVSVANHPKIKLYTLSEVVEVDGYVGNFKARILKKARYVDLDKCTNCGDCEKVCPVEVSSEFDRNLGRRKAIYIPFAQAIPAAYSIDPETCLGFQPVICGACKDACERDAINYDDTDEYITEDVGTIIVATGYDLYPKENIGEYGYGQYPDVIDSLQFERLLSSSGPTGGTPKRPSDGKIPKTVVFIQCVGSRDVNHLEYCSKICCMFTAKHALLYKHLVPDGKAIIFYIDVRAAGKGYEEFIKRVSSENNVLYIRGRVASVREEDGKVIIEGNDTLTGDLLKLEADLVVLAMGTTANPDNKKIANLLRIPIDEWGFFKETHPKLKPVETSSNGIFVCGAAHAPKDIAETVAQASAAASKALGLLSSDKLTHEPIIAEVNSDKCSSCRTCETTCPFGAISIGSRGAEVNEVLCEGCGACVAACPSAAISLRNVTDEQIYRMLDVILTR